MQMVFFTEIKAKDIIKNIPYGLIVVFLGYLAILTIIYKVEEKAGLRLVNIKTSSMKPLIPPSSFIITKPQNEYHVGDVVTYREINPKTNHEFSRTITHRIVKEKEGGVYITQGDSNKYPDPYEVEKDNILGKVVYTLPYLGYLGFVVKTIPGFLVFVAIPSFFLILSETRYLKNELKKLATWG